MSTPAQAPRPDRPKQLAKLDQLEGAALERYKLQVDLYKTRAEEYRDRYESMRSLEWKVLFQVYAGYAAIAVAFRFVHDKFDKHPSLTAVLAMAATLVFYAATRYLAFRIEERLSAFEATRRNYLAEIDSAFDLHEPIPGTRPLGHKGFWTFDVQLILSALTLAGLLGFEAASAPLVSSLWGTACLGLLALAVILLEGRWVRAVLRRKSLDWNAFYESTADPQDDMKKI